MTLFVGRAAESEQLRACADEVRAGASRLVVVEGEAGIGKTSLVRGFTASLDDFTVLWATADPSETDFPYGVTGQLTRRLDRAAVAGFPLLAEPAPGSTPHVIGGQLLLLLGELQQSGRPVAVVVDDLQWADRQSVQALGFVLRRLWSDRVLTILATRPVAESDNLLRSSERATRLELGGLSGDEVASLARALIAGPLTPGLSERLHAYTGGHPLHARTVLTEVPADVLRDDTQQRWPVPRSLLLAINTQFDRLPAGSREMLEAMAVLDARMPLSAVGRLAGLADPAEALGPALTAGLAVWWPSEPQSPVALVHALQRDAIYDALSPARRRALHAGAAGLVGTAASWSHRVAAADSTDDDLAAELEQSGTAEAALGRNAVAATRLRWASALSTGRDDRERRLLTSCAQSLLTLRADAVLPLRPQVEDCAPGPLRSCVLGIMDMMAGRIPTAETHLGQAWEEARATPGAGWVAALASLFLAQITIASGRGADTVRIARRTLDIGDLDPSTTDLTRALLATGRMWHVGPAAALDDLTHLPEAGVDVRDDNLDTLATRGVMRLFLGHLPAARADLRTVALRDQQGASSRLGPATLALQSVVHYLAGEWDESESAAERARAVAASQDQLAFDAAGRFAAVCVDAGRGEWPRAERRLDELSHIVQSFGSPPDIVYSSLAAATVAQARADHAGMHRSLGPLLDGTRLRYRPFRLWQQSLLVEALTGTGRLDEAEAVLHDLRAEHDGGYLRDVVARLTGQIAEARNRPRDAEETYRQALTFEVDADTAPLYRGALEHAYGKLLLATGSTSRRDAATWLTRAHRRFAALRATPFQQRCEQDLTATGLTVAEGAPGRPLTLTERELSVAHVIANGRTNQEAAAELYVSQKTVEYHLSRIYAKLGISSRRLLAEALRNPS
ncbi:AAA family ATPase [Actinoplanes sp. LDG1-06]|uniref:AAA family ATPase n=1 Tax=Paractinoplanes ovalisporus TaxID=2810368 RepID=A0ABS2ALZ5_9ACTN|nr:LuxR family transcriptional regulator [Actinoplanes ovalisporus]MBM2620806.1 AAA family ATPase [Actinoplanes ovalisporus]